MPNNPTPGPAVFDLRSATLTNIETLGLTFSNITVLVDTDALAGFTSIGGAPFSGNGDTVVTSGGLVGKVTKVVDDDQIEFEISDGVRVRQMRQMISGVRAKGEPAKDKTESAKDETSAG